MCPDIKADESPKETPQLGNAEQAFLARLQQRAEKCKPDHLFVSFLETHGLHVKRLRIKDIDFVAGSGGKNYALIFTTSNKESLEFSIDRLEQLTEFHAAFGFMPLIAIFWRRPKMPLYRIMSLADGDVRIYKFGDMAHNIKEKTFVASKVGGVKADSFSWK